MSELKRRLKRGLISIEAGVLDLRWGFITLELGDDDYLQYLGVVRIIKGVVRNPLGLILPNVDSLSYYGSERIILSEIIERLNLYYRTERNIVISQFIPRIFITSSANQLELFDVRCNLFAMYDTLFNRYLSNNGLSSCSENYYLMKMGVCLN